MNVLAFDIETIPDVDGGRLLYELGDLPEPDVVRAMQQLRRQKTGGSDFMPPHLHRVIAVACVLRSSDGVKVWSLGQPDSSESELIARFFDGVAKFRPVLVSWNGGGFDLPVLNYRALIHGIEAGVYWETGEAEQSFRFNNYLSRFHWRHIDLMDVLSNWQIRSAAPLDEIAKLLGLPGKMGMHGSDVFAAWKAGRIEDIRHYCESDALNTYLIWLKFEHLRAHLSQDALREEWSVVKAGLSLSEGEHLQPFLDWEI